MEILIFKDSDKLLIATVPLHLQDLFWGLLIENFSLYVFTALYEYYEDQFFFKKVFIGKAVEIKYIDLYEFNRLCHVHIVHIMTYYIFV